MSHPRHLLDRYALFPKKSLGQNFLFDPNALQKIAQIAEVGPEDTILEIGTGLGSLTKVLAPQSQQVHTVEVDERFGPLLREEFEDYENIRLHWGDILQLDLTKILAGRPYKVVANLPYYITSAILRKLLESPHKPQSLTVMVQKQVAERLVAKPDDMSILSVSVQFYGDPKIKMTLKPQVFFPRPDVDSAVVHLEVAAQNPLGVGPRDEGKFFELVRAGFGQKRKQLKNSLASNLPLGDEQVAAILAAAGIDGTRRAETLQLQEWAAMTQAYLALSA